MGGVWWPHWHTVDWEHEYCTRWQQKGPQHENVLHLRSFCLFLVLSFWLFFLHSCAWWVVRSSRCPTRWVLFSKPWIYLRPRWLSNYLYFGFLKQQQKNTLFFSLYHWLFGFLSLPKLQPATVSRCGMIFMEPSQLGWEPLVISWINTLPKPLQGSEYRTLLLDLFHWLLPPTLRMLRKNCRVNF